MKRLPITEEPSFYSPKIALLPGRHIGCDTTEDNVAGDRIAAVAIFTVPIADDFTGGIEPGDDPPVLIKANYLCYPLTKKDGVSLTAITPYNVLRNCLKIT